MSMYESEFEESMVVDESTENICHINSLPIEILDLIFAKLSCSDETKDVFRKELRLVCKLWFQKCSRRGSIYISKDIFQKASKLPECYFERLEVTFGEATEIDVPPNLLTGLDQLPVAFWLNFGTRIVSLDLLYCKLGDHVMKNIIIFGNNLQSLLVDMLILDEEPFCSPEMLEGLKVERPQLNTLRIRFDGQKNPVINYNFFKWKRTFIALLRIFPNVVHYDVGDLNDYLMRKWDSDDANFGRFRMEFSLNRACTFWTETMISELATSLAYSLSIDSGDWRNALDVLPVQTRITHIELYFIKMRSYAVADMTTLLNFFGSHRELESIHVELGFEIDEHMSKCVFFQIIQNCSKLCKLVYGQEYEAGWLYGLTTTEWSLIFDMTPRIEVLRLGESILRSSSKSQLTLTRFEFCDFNCYMRIVIQNYAYIRDLKLVGLFYTDEVLQCILQFMVNLKSLSLELGKHVTTFGLTGYSDDKENFSEGYSISRLKNLEQLNIVRNKRWKKLYKIDDTILFQEFKLPKLRILTCHPPEIENQEIFADLGEEMPLLDTIIFRKPKTTTKYLVNLCRSFKNLRSLSVSKITFNIDRAKEIFGVCPSLRYLRRGLTFSGYYYEPFTREVRQFD